MNWRAFVDAAHRRTVTLGIISVLDPTAIAGVRAAPFTDWCLAFPETDEQDALAVFFINKRASTLVAIRKELHFALNLMRADHIHDVPKIYGKQYDASLFVATPYAPAIRDASTVFYCRYRRDTIFFNNNYHMVECDILDASFTAPVADPIINHERSYWQLGHRFGSASDPNVQNLRLP